MEQSADLRDDANASANSCSFGLGATHSAQSGRQEDSSFQAVESQVLAAGVQHRQLLNVLSMFRFYLNDTQVPPVGLVSRFTVVPWTMPCGPM